MMLNQVDHNHDSGYEDDDVIVVLKTAPHFHECTCTLIDTYICTYVYLSFYSAICHRCTTQSFDFLIFYSC